MKQTTVILFAIGLMITPALAQTTTAPKPATDKPAKLSTDKPDKLSCGKTVEECQAIVDKLKSDSEVQAKAYQLVRQQRDMAQQALSDALLGVALKEQTGASSAPQ